MYNKNKEIPFLAIRESQYNSSTELAIPVPFLLVIHNVGLDRVQPSSEETEGLAIKRDASEVHIDDDVDAVLCDSAAASDGAIPVENALLSTLLSFLAVCAFELVLCPRTGRPW